MKPTLIKKLIDEYLAPLVAKIPFFRTILLRYTDTAAQFSVGRLVIVFGALVTYTNGTLEKFSLWATGDGGVLLQLPLGLEVGFREFMAVAIPMLYSAVMRQFARTAANGDPGE